MKKSFNLKETDFVVCFWYAEDINKESYLMVLRKKPFYWQLDWLFRYEHYDKFYNALSGLATPEAEVIEIGRGAFIRTQPMYPLKRIFQQVNGSVKQFYTMANEWGLRIHKEII